MGNVRLKLRRSVCTAAVLATVACLGCGSQPKALAPIITNQPVAFSSREFDPARPPADMPPLGFGEAAECDADFTSKASVAGALRPTDATHATVTVTQVRMTLGLNVTIWAPVGATQQVMDHEAGHRQIAERYYGAAGQIAARIAQQYTGRQIMIEGANLDAEFNKALQQISNEITEEYSKQLNPNPAQLRYDAITDHARNDVPASSGVTQALAENPPS